MTSHQGSSSTPAPQPTPQPTPSQAPAQTSSPNQYHLRGDGIAVSFFPKGFGPVSAGGAARLIYQDAHRSLNFTGQDVRVVEVADLGTVVSVTLVRTVDIGFTAFSLLVPQIVLPAQSGSVPVQTESVTTVHRLFAGAIGQAQRETYTVTPLSGTASAGILPM